MQSLNSFNADDVARLPLSGLAPAPANSRGRLTSISVKDFKSFMQLIAKYELWNELEAELSSQGCTKFRISVEPMRMVGLALREKVLHGDLPADSPALAACGCGGCTPHTSDAGSGSGGGVLAPGTSEGSDAGSDAGHPQ